MDFGISFLRRFWSPRPLTFGERGERAAERFLRGLGYRILARQHRNVGGELDLIALDGDTVVFVEVKTRAATDRGDPTESVTADKQRRIARAAAVYMKRRGWMTRRCRFDVIAVVWSDKSQPPQITHYKHAFESAV